MKQTIPNIAHTAAVLSPSDVNANAAMLKRDVEDAIARRYFRSNGTLRWDALTNASDAALRRTYFSPPAAIEIVGIEVQVYGTAAETFTLSLVVAGTTVWTQTITMSGATTLVEHLQGVSFTVAALASCYVEVSGTSYNINSLCVGMAMRYDRHTGNEPPAITPLAVKSGNDCVAATINTFITAVDAAMDDDDANTDAVRFTFVRGPTNVSSAVTATTYTTELPATQASLARMEGYLVAPVTETMRVRVTDDVAAIVATEDIVGAGAGSTASGADTGALGTQTDDDPTDSADDWTLVFSQVAGAPATIVTMYAILWWE